MPGEPKSRAEHREPDGFAVSGCLICGSGRLHPKFRVAFPDYGPDLTHVWPVQASPPVEHWTIVGCRECGVHFPNPFPSRSTIDEFYSSQLVHNDWEQVHYVDETESRSQQWDSFADKIARAIGGTGEMLEVGPAAGHLLIAARKRGWSVLGIEATPKFGRILQDRGVPAHLGTLETFEASQQFDAVVLTDVLEHLHDPIGDLARISRLLKPSGIVVISTPDIGSLAAQHYGLRWRQIVISHTFYWTERSLRVALRRAGLQPRQVSSTRWWDPDPFRQRKAWVREFTKLVARQVFHHSWIPLAKRSNAAMRFQQGHPRFDHLIEYRVGDQPVMSEVLLATASPSPSPPAVTS